MFLLFEEGFGMVYGSVELKQAAFAVLEDDVVTKLVFKKNNNDLFEIDLSDPSGAFIPTNGPASIGSTFVFTQTQGGTLEAPTSFAPFKFQPRDPNKGAFMFRLYGGQANSTWNSIFSVGYNSDVSKVGEPSVELAMEQDYEPSPGVHKMEMYFQFGNASRTAFLRPFFSDFDRTTEAMSTEISATSLIRFRHAVTAADWATLSSTGLLFGAAGQVLQFLTNGTLTFNSVNGISIFNTNGAQTSLFYRANTHSFQTAAAAPILTLSSSGGPPVIINGNGNGNAVVFIRQSSGTQFFSVQEWQTSAGAVLSKIDLGGRFVTKVNSAPADADLTASECAFWFDPTNGAAKVRFKAKQTDGTVRTGEVLLV